MGFLRCFWATVGGVRLRVGLNLLVYLESVFSSVIHVRTDCPKNRPWLVLFAAKTALHAEGR